MEGNLSDALFLSNIYENQELLDYYYTLTSKFVNEVYRSDGNGPLYQRMNIYSDFISKYNSERVDVEDKKYSYINYFMYPLSERLQEQLNIEQTSVQYDTLPTCLIHSN